MCGRDYWGPYAEHIFVYMCICICIIYVCICIIYIVYVYVYVWEDYWGPYAEHISRVELTKYANTKLFRCHLNKSKNPKIIIWKIFICIFSYFRFLSVFFRILECQNSFVLNKISQSQITNGRGSEKYPDSAVTEFQKNTLCSLYKSFWENFISFWPLVKFSALYLCNDRKKTFIPYNS